MQDLLSLLISSRSRCSLGFRFSGAVQPQTRPFTSEEMYLCDMQQMLSPLILHSEKYLQEMK